ncbi:MAG TPA: hypothetical protein VF212_05285 [Longimicrobiales bacterium]
MVPSMCDVRRLRGRGLRDQGEEHRWRIGDVVGSTTSSDRRHRRGVVRRSAASGGDAMQATWTWSRVYLLMRSTTSTSGSQPGGASRHHQNRLPLNSSLDPTARFLSNTPVQK